ncbi:MAG: hypothetical protein WBR26_22895 [Candidatus Acidiferrum sp.]
MKAKDKTKELDAFVERLRVAFDTLDGREAAKLLKQLDRAIRRTLAFKQAIAEAGQPASDPIEAMKRLLPLL